MKRLLSNLLLLILLTGVISCSEDPSSTLLIGTNAEFPPYVFEEDGEIRGFEIDIAQEICSRLGKKMQLVDMPFNALIDEVKKGEVDFVAAGISFSEERAKDVAFTRPYLFEDPLVILSFQGKDELMSLEELKGKKVAVNKGYNADQFMSQQKEITLLKLRTVSDGFSALMSGKVDAFVTSYNSVKPFFKSMNSKIFEVSPISGTSEDCSIISQKDNPALLADIQGALDAMDDDGTLERLRVKWDLL